MIRRALLLGVAALALAAPVLATGTARAELAPETVGQVAVLPAPGPHWIFVSDLLLRRAALR